MKNKHKIILVKGVIAIGAILLIITFILLVILNDKVEGSIEYLFYDRMAMFTFILSALDAIIMLILMCKIDIRPEKTKPMRLKLKDTDYETIKKNLCKKHKQKGYKKLSEYGDTNIGYMIKQNHSVISLIIYIKMEEMAEKILHDFEEHILAKQILNLENIIPNNKLDITYIVTVDKVTPTFSKYTERNIKQTFWTTVLPVGISLASKTLYISTQEDGFSILRYKKMKKQFINDIDDMLEK